MTKVPYVHSNYKRKEGDDYQTLDPRCIYGLLEHFPKLSTVIDPCADKGSGIVDCLSTLGYDAIGWQDAYADWDFKTNWVVTNPPYARDVVDKIICRQIARLENGDVEGVAVLLRSNFDFAKKRKEMFNGAFYYGQIKLRFRPWWSEERKAQPIHNYCWHIWKLGVAGFPIVMYSDGNPQE